MISEDSNIRKFELYQNQRLWVGIFKGTLLPHERPSWSDEAGKLNIKKDSIMLPDKGGWNWQSNWLVESDTRFQDKDGWSYAYDFSGPWKKSKGMMDFVRRRKWVRIAKPNAPADNRASGIASLGASMMSAQTVDARAQHGLSLEHKKNQ